VSLIVDLYKVAMACVEEASTARPTMREVVHMLSNSAVAQLQPAEDNLLHAF
jgi:hypothetical protein